MVSFRYPFFAFLVTMLLLVSAACCSLALPIQLGPLIEKESSATSMPVLPTPTDFPTVLPVTPLATHTPAQPLNASPPQQETGPTRTPISRPTRQPKTQLYDVVETIRLTNQGPGTVKRLLLRAAMIIDREPFQEVLSTSLTPAGYQESNDEFGNRYAVFEIEDIAPDDEVVIEMVYQVRVQGTHFVTQPCQGEVISDYLQAETYIESDSTAITNLAQGLTAEQETLCQKERAIYDYITENMTYSGYNPGDIGAQVSLSSMSGDCTEFADLTTALSRAAGIPARVVDGVICCTDGGYSEAQNKHNWIEAYLPGAAWVSIDPTWGRNIYDREEYFAKHPSTHIIITRGRNLSMLNNYHYFSYNYWWDDEEVNITGSEEFSILESESD